MGTAPRPHEDCVDVEAAIGLLKRFKPTCLVIAHAMYSPCPDESERILAFDNAKSRLRKIADFWLRSEDIPTFKAAGEEASDVVYAQCDGMYATSPKLVWAKVNGFLNLWQRNQATMRFGPQQIHVRGYLGRWRSHQTETFRTCHAFLSPTWMLRGLRLKRKSGSSIVVAKHREPLALIDPTYDVLDLLGDTEWLVNLSRAVADATGLPLKMHRHLE